MPPARSQEVRSAILGDRARLQSPPMRKPDPERIYEARRSATYRRIVDEQRLDELDAEHWIAAWEREAASHGLDPRAAFWDEGRVWIERAGA
jgi:hypothetical protein